MANNGMESYSIHAGNRAQLDEIRALKDECTARGFGVDAGAEAVDAETAARQHLAVALASPNLPAYSRPEVAGLEGGFKLLGTETIELTGTTTVKFRQTFNKVPVYGSLVTVELDEANNLIGLNSALGTPEGVAPNAEVAPSAALRIIAEAGGLPDPNAPVRPLYYFDRRVEPPRWRLCYLVEDVALAELEGGDDGTGDDERHGVGRLPAPTENFFVDAHSGEIVARLPRAADASAPPVAQVSALDELNSPRTIRVSPQSGAPTLMYDPQLNIHTFDYKFADAAPSTPAPPSYCYNPPVWDKGAVSAHANAAAVCDFLRTVLKRRGVDNQDGPLHSSIRCAYRTRTPGAPQQWLNAMWHRGQMYYGQRKTAAGDYVSLAVDLEIVAHEITHGLTQASANLEYWFESGALNESYSDIFGVIIANYDLPARSTWDYRIGRNFSGTGVPLRSMADPSAYGQPDHMNNYRHLLATQDNGGVHINSGIHNKAAHAICTAQDAAGNPLFSAAELAGIFYLSLTQHLSRTSLFADSRRGVELSAMTLLRQLPPAALEERIAGIRAAFDSVGIS